MATNSSAIVDDASLASQSAVVDTSTDAAATSNDDASQVDTTQVDDQQVDTTQVDDQQATDTLTDIDADGRKLPNYVKALKETDPKSYARAKTEFFDLAARRAVHQTVQAAREEHELVTSYGGAEGIAKLREDGQYFKTAAQQFLKGDPEFVKDLFDEDPIAAELHVPHFLEAYKTKNLEGYKTTLAQLWDTEFKSVGFIENGIKPLIAAIQAGNKEAALEIANSIHQWQNSISETARKGPSPREKALLAERAKQHETREQSEKDDLIKQYRTDSMNGIVEDGSKIFDSFFKGRKIDAEDRNDLLREAFAVANRAVSADKQFTEQRDQHLNAGDSAAALKLSRARFARELPEAVKRVARRYGMIAGPVKNTLTEKPNGGTPPAAQGFTQLNALPNPNDIDRTKSPKEMLQSGRAILKNGRKVSWAHLRAQVA